VPEPTRETVRPLLLGMGWFPDQAGGLNRYFADLYRALETDGLRPRAVVLGPVSDAPERVAAPAISGDPLLQRLRRYARAARAVAPDIDVVDVHFALYGLVPILTSLRSKPLLVHFQGPWADESTAAGERSGIRVWAKRRLERAVYGRARELVTLSFAFKRLLVERYRVSPWRVHVIPPGVDLERFSPGVRDEARKALGLPPHLPIGVTIRRLLPRMGIYVLLDAWARLSEHRHDACLVVVGDGPERPALERRAAQLGLTDRVRFVGRVDDEDLPTFYRAADVSLVPSLSLEGFGLVVLESLACGTPVIVTDAGGLPETVAGLDSSLVVPAGNPDALATRLEGAFSHDRPLPDPQACRSFAQDFSLAEVASRHRALYAQAVNPGTRDKLRVVYLDHCAQLSGGELALLRLLPALEPEVEPHVILGEEGPLVEHLTRAGISTEVLPLAPTAGKLRRDRIRMGALPAASVFTAAAYSIRLARRLHRLAPDLVHTNSLKSALYGGVASRLAGRPVVWHVRDRIAPDYLPSPAVKLVRAAALRVPNALIANSQTTLETLGDAARLATVVPSPIVIHDPLWRVATVKRVAGTSLLFGVAGRIAPWKGQHVFLEAFAQAFRDSDAKAVIIGAPLFGEEDYKRELERLASELRLDGRVEFRGFREDMASELAHLEVLVHSSVIPEPFGQVVTEAMSVGLPVVAADAGGPAEVIEHGVNGLLYPPGDVEGLASALRTLAADASLRKRLGDAGRDSARAFAPELIAAQVLEVYRRVSDRPGTEHHGSTSS
jgi:glycosyltransferase involved in cell wall biosynthesis